MSILDSPLVVMENTSYVTWRDVIFEASRGSAVKVTGGTEAVIRGCTVRNLAEDAIIVHGGTGHGVIGCEIYDVGKGGIILLGGDRQTLTHAGHYATDNHIHHYARLERTYKPAIALRGIGCRAAHNLIYDAPHEAVSFSGNEHVIELNEVHHVCTETDDAGAIYTGRDWTARGNVIRYNYWHHIEGGDHIGVQAIYLDDAASGTTVCGNVIVEVQRGMHIGGGRDNIIENNLIVGCQQALSFDARGLGWMKYHVEPGGALYESLKQVPYQDEPWVNCYPNLVDILDDEPGAPKYNTVRNNAMVDSGPAKIAEPVAEHGTVEHNVVIRGDPGFVDQEGMNYRLREDAQVYRQLPGFEPIPFDEIGPRDPDP